ncbi:sugar phosphate isomerase/epimerase family protein [Thermasporomyces composti]|jgi:sugar phosphate isomerase/epimerase|uniref:Sugar phosphate isomerase/epimerase n=1 Tax=Thermasporomyces composti TaxID=696763 RepID=A0A3D9VFP1_THECX|nr:sugar phosphate isomerase/epimerase family protein [Thermasporomyces composti]REF37975.1 sugar phosphate isomerase/epimerase [Thermasporomyces composti]
MWTLSGFADEIDPDPHIQFQTLNELGIRYVEFRSAWGTNVLDLSDEQIAEIKRLLARYGISVSAVGSPIGKVGIHDDFDEHLARFDRALWVARELSAPYIRLFSFWIPEGDDPAKHRDEVLRRMSALAERARGHDVVLAHENERKIYGDIPSRCLDIVESVGSDNLRLVWDAANFVLCDVAPFTDGYASLRPYIEYLQIKDAVAADGRIVPAGEGDGEIPETIRALRDDGFDGFFSMEPHLATAGHAGGFSGPELFAKATRAFTGLLEAEGISYQ